MNGAAEAARSIPPNCLRLNKPETSVFCSLGAQGSQVDAVQPLHALFTRAFDLVSSSINFSFENF
jgi:hypothetical protein